MNQRLLTAIAAASLVFAAGCGGGPGGGVAINSVNPTSPTYSSLQFAVGTANLYGNPKPGLNVVSTFRQNDGASATGVNTPKIGGNFFITASAVPSFAEANPSSGFPDPYTTAFNGGPSDQEDHGNAITGTSQTITAGTPSCDGPGPFPSAPAGQAFVRCPNGLKANTTTFGQSGGVYAMGLLPANAVASTGQGYSYQPYPQPFYNSADKTSKYQFVPWGGPPAFDPNNDGMGTRDGLYVLGSDSFGDPYFLGVGEGVTVFDGVKPRAGTYQLTVAVSTISGSGTSTSSVSKTAHLASLAMLPTVHAPVFHPDGNGGGHFTATMPAGVSEAYVQIVDWGPGGGPNNGAVGTPTNCQGPRGTAFAPVYYTFLVQKSGTYDVPDANGPNLDTSGGPTHLRASPTICTAAQNNKAASNVLADDIVIQMIGFNYPAYEAAHSLILNTTPQNPPISNGSGQSDVTISEAMEQNDGSTSQSPAIAVARRAVHETPTLLEPSFGKCRSSLPVLAMRCIDPSR